MNIKTDDHVRVKRDISRWEDKDYAKAGQSGVVLEVFRNGHQSGNNADHRPWYAKVLIGGQVKTLRLTSIEPVGARSEDADHPS